MICTSAKTHIAFIATKTTPCWQVSVPAWLIILASTRREEQWHTQDESQEKFWRSVSMAPSDVFSNLSHRFRELDLRLQKMEAYVTSREFDMDRDLITPQTPCLTERFGRLN